MAHLFSLAAIAAAFAAPAFAQSSDYCRDLWFTRNQIYDRAGQCFNSSLGAAMFDNSDCTGSPELSGLAAQKVAMISALEAELQCNIDTSQARLELPLLDLRYQLEDIPVLAEYASGCLQWGGPLITLYAGHRDGAATLGTVGPGDDIVWEHDTPGTPAGWEFISVYRGARPVSLGWSNTPIDYNLCGRLAG